jgi:hypothetical protein
MGYVAAILVWCLVFGVWCYDAELTELAACDLKNSKPHTPNP